MKLKFIPDVRDFHVIIETTSYSGIWDEYGQKLLSSFTKVTGLSFEQRQITVRIKDVVHATAGNARQAMLLPADGRSYERKCLVMAHELGHRLLGGNALGSVSLGYSNIDHTKSEDEMIAEVDHMLLYVFLGDVVREVFPEVISKQYEEYESSGADSPHQRAYNWAVSLTTAERRALLDYLLAKFVPREKWEDIETAPYTPPIMFIDQLNRIVKQRPTGL